MVSLDISKAFNAMSHCLIHQRMKELDVHPVMRRYLANIYSGNTTDICWNKYQLSDTQMRRGVKQGDLLSPWIFNSIVDERHSMEGRHGRGKPKLPWEKVIPADLRAWGI